MSELQKIAGALALLVGLAGVSGGVGARSVTTAPEGAVVTSARAKSPVHSATVSIDGVSDGDTFYVRLDGSSVRVRLAEVDAPEKRQPFGRRSEQALRALLGSGPVVLRWSELDKYGRIVAHAEAGGLDVGREMVRGGWAWTYTAYARDPMLPELERTARAQRAGLWADAVPVAPWEWRKAHRAGGQHE